MKRRNFLKKTIPGAAAVVVAPAVVKELIPSPTYGPSPLQLMVPPIDYYHRFSPAVDLPEVEAFIQHRAQELHDEIAAELDKILLSGEGCCPPKGITFRRRGLQK